MPHIDELLGVATVATAGMLAGIAIQAPTNVAPVAAGAPTKVVTATTATQPVVAPIARLPAVNMTAKRGVDAAAKLTS